MIPSLSGSIIPWLLGGLVLLTVFAFSITIKSWREAKRSPYFFLRVQSAKKMQRYMVFSFSVVLLLVVSATYAWQAPEETTPQIARLRYTKPTDSSETVIAEADGIAQSSPTALQIDLAPDSRQLSEADADLIDPQLLRSLPTEYDNYEASVELDSDTDIGQISFSTDISDEYQAVTPEERFGAGFFTLYATFDYEEMADGMSWSWVWRRNGDVIDGGNQIWAYGDSGPGYVYLRPEEGFDLGEYSLEVWVNGEMMAMSDFMVTDSVSASN